MTSEIILKWITPGTSPIDWCEANYTVTPYIAEFVNTISNIIFLLVPFACSGLWASYARHVSRGIHIIWVFFTVIGLCSAYFHATLSLLGQLLDELSILWVLMVSYSLFTPMRCRPRILRSHPLFYSATISGSGLLVTASAFLHPAINAYALFIVAVPAFTILVIEVRKCRNRPILRLSTITFTSLALAATSWVFDRFLCHIWLALNFTILHGVWHVLIFVGGYTTQVLFCYFHAAQDVPKSRPVLKFWPAKNWVLPYVSCTDPRDNKTP